mgnify:CR=1 FL=1
MMQHPIRPPAAPVVRESATPPPQVILTLVNHNGPASDVHLPQEGRQVVSEGRLDLATGVSLNVAEVTHVALRGHRPAMIFLQTKILRYCLGIFGFFRPRDHSQTIDPKNIGFRLMFIDFH